MISIHSLSELERLKLQETAYHELVARHFLSEFKPDRGEPAPERGVPAFERADPPGRTGPSLGSRRVGGAPAWSRPRSVPLEPGPPRKQELKGFG